MDIPPFKGKKYKKGTETWTEEYDAYRRKYHLCNSPMAWVLMRRKERAFKEMFGRTPALIKFLGRF